ncbi:MAG: 4Fe-4S binding protein [Candidatus Omnitrophota bacterium]|jgi:ferredoxin
MAKRKIIKIDNKKCNGCGLCIPNCPEGALKVIDGKVRLVSDLFCDGLGACIGHCPRGAITIEERQAGEYDETRVMRNIVKQGVNVIRAHLEHLKGHGEHKLLKQALEYLKEKGIEDPVGGGEEHPGHKHGVSGCPGSRMMDLRGKDAPADKAAPGGSGPIARGVSRLGQWPVQIHLVPVNAPYFDGADLLVAADCVPFAYADFHEDFLKGKVLLIGCPKLDDAHVYQDKIAQILKNNNIRSVTCAHMEVPCCFGLVNLIKTAIETSGKKIPFKDITIGIRGGKLQ